ncbi:hypothetical protein DNC80_12685 [Flavobacterium sp. SOK18b]|nr:hypothetical protein [Flavobacterium sp. SOK18b]
MHLLRKSKEVLVSKIVLFVCERERPAGAHKIGRKRILRKNNKHERDASASSRATCLDSSFLKMTKLKNKETEESTKKKCVVSTMPA